MHLHEKKDQANHPSSPPTEPTNHISALLDIVFKYLLGCRESTPLLTDFINAVQKDSGFPEIEEVSIENPFNEKTFTDDKLSINLLNFNHFPNNIPWYSCFLLREIDNPDFILTLEAL